MTQEEKFVLLRDLSARLPYGVIVKVSKEDNGSIKSYDKYFDAEIYDLLLLNGAYEKRGIIYHYSQFSLKPYLRPMSSMTEEEKKEFHHLASLQRNYLGDGNFYTHYQMIDWLDKNMFDYRGLIPMGLALKAKPGMYNN